jgi:hypothetical protein
MAWVIIRSMGPIKKNTYTTESCYYLLTRQNSSYHHIDVVINGIVYREENEKDCSD